MRHITTFFYSLINIKHIFQLPFLFSWKCMQQVVYFVVDIILLGEYVVLISHKMSLFRFNFKKQIWLPECSHFLQSEETWSESANQFFECCRSQHIPLQKQVILTKIFKTFLDLFSETQNDVILELQRIKTFQPIDQCV